MRPSDKLLAVVKSMDGAPTARDKRLASYVLLKVQERAAKGQKVDKIKLEEVLDDLKTKGRKNG